MTNKTSLNNASVILRDSEMPRPTFPTQAEGANVFSNCGQAHLDGLDRVIVRATEIAASHGEGDSSCSETSTSEIDSHTSYSDSDESIENYLQKLLFRCSQFLSEKAFKGIAYKHPFILLSTPGTLNCLTKIGYQTFDGIIDETYDTIENDGDRFKAILLETERLCNMNNNDLSDWLNKAKEICDYNYNVLINKKVFQHKLNYE